MMSSPVRVGFVVHVMQVAGAEVLVSEIIQRLGARVRPTIFCLDAIGALGERLQADGADVVALGRRPGLDLHVAGALARGIRERDIEVVHAHQYTPFFYTALGRLVGQHDARVILTEHGRHYPDIVSWKRRAFNHLVLDRMADSVNAVCGFSADALAAKDGFARGRIEVIENGIDLERYRDGRSAGLRASAAALNASAAAAPGATTDGLDGSARAEARAALGLDPARRYIACVARFHPVKDHAMLIRGFAAVAASQPAAHLLLVGDGPLRPELTALVASLGITDRVTFMGVRRDVPLILQAVDIFALTSVSEGASITLLEAMASALPLVVTAVGGNRELVRDGVDGLLVPRGDHEALAAAITGLLQSPARAADMGRSGETRVREQYRLEDTVRRYDHLYRTLARRSH